MGDSSEKDKKWLCDNPRDQQESARPDGQHQMRAEMMIVTLTAKGTPFFFHAERAYSASSKTVKSVGAAQRVKHTGRRDDCHGGLLFPPERDEHGLAFQLRKEKSSLDGSRQL